MPVINHNYHDYLTVKDNQEVVPVLTPVVHTLWGQKAAKQSQKLEVYRHTFACNLCTFTGP